MNFIYLMLALASEAPYYTLNYEIIKTTLITCKESLESIIDPSPGVNHTINMISIADSFLDQNCILNKRMLKILHEINFDEISIRKDDDLEAYFLLHLLSSITNLENLVLYTEDKEAEEIVAKMCRTSKYDYFMKNLIRNIAKFIFKMSRNINKHKKPQVNVPKCFETPIYNLFISQDSRNLDIKYLAGASIFFREMLPKLDKDCKLTATFTPIENTQTIISKNNLIKSYDFPNLIKNPRYISLDNKNDSKILDNKNESKLRDSKNEGNLLENTFFLPFDDNIALAHTYLYMLKFISECTLNWCDIELTNGREIIAKFEPKVRLSCNEKIKRDEYSAKLFKDTYFISCFEYIKSLREYLNARNILFIDNEIDTALLEYKYTAENVYNKLMLDEKPLEIYCIGWKDSKNKTESKNKGLNPVKVRFRNEVYNKYKFDVIFYKELKESKDYDLNLRCITAEKTDSYENIFKLIKDVIKKSNQMSNTGNLEHIQNYKYLRNKMERTKNNIKNMKNKYLRDHNIIYLEDEFVSKNEILTWEELQTNIKNSIKEFKKIFKANKKSRDKLYKVCKIKEDQLIKEYIDKPLTEISSSQEVEIWTYSNLINLYEISDDQIFDETFYSVVKSRHFDFPEKEAELEIFYFYVRALAVYKKIQRNIISEICSEKLLSLYMQQF